MSPAPRIVISMRTLRPGQMGGSETYADGLLRALARQGALEYVCLVPPAARHAGNGLPTVVGRDDVGRADAVHYPFTVPLPRLGAPSAVTVHDLLHRDRPACLSRRQRLFRLFAYDRAARRASVVICPSEYVRGRLHEALGIPLERLRPIHHGIDRDVFRPGSEEREPFLLYPARAWAHKNHERLFRAFELLRGERPELELVLSGGGQDPNRLPAGVRALGHISRDELARLYRRAAALVFPSLHEGFGQPPLEAMASGCPVACSDATSLPEVCGEAAVYFDPTSAEAIADGVRRALTDADELRERGFERARAFSWEQSARAHEEAYRAIASA